MELLRQRQGEKCKMRGNINRVSRLVEVYEFGFLSIKGQVVKLAQVMQVFSVFLRADGEGAISALPSA